MPTLEAVRSRQQKAIYVLAFVLVIVLYLAWLMQMGLADLRRSQAELDEFVHNACLSRVENVERSNARSLAFIEIERDNPFADAGPAEQAIIDRRIAVWEASILDVPDCSQ